MEDRLIPLDGLTLAQVAPFGTRLLVRADPLIDWAAEVIGIILPESVTSYNPETFPISGRVLKVGPRVTDVQVGDRVWFPRYGGKQLEIDGLFYLMLDEEDVWGTWDAPPLPTPAMDPESADVRVGR